MISEYASGHGEDTRRAHHAAPTPERGTSRAPLAQRFRGDAAAITVLATVCVAWTAAAVVPITSFMRGDWATFFLPTYAFLGARLRAFDVPGWNPHQFAGVPFAGDPESGWAYVPAMLTYSLFAPEHATVLFIGGHVVLAGSVLYTLARLLGLDRLGSFVAGAAFSLAWVTTASSHMVLSVEVTIWLIVSLIGVEISLSATTRDRRIWGWLIAGIGISQVLAAWLGQGAYYALLVIGAWLVYRACRGVLPAAAPAARIRHVAVNGLGVAGAGLALSAAGLLPRLDAVGRSNLAGAVYRGSSDWADRQTGYAPAELLQEVLGGYTGSLWWYAGAVATGLALMAPVVAWRWAPMPFLALLAAGSAVLALSPPTPVRALLSAAVPFFERLHGHAPDRILILYPLAVALLAGATVSCLAPWTGSRSTLIAAAALPIAAATILGMSPSSFALISRQSTALMMSAGVLVLLASLTRTPIARLAVPLAICALIVWDPAGRIIASGFVDESHLEHSLQGSLTEVKEARESSAAPGPPPAPNAAHNFLAANGPAAFLLAAAAAEPDRYAGFDPALLEGAGPDADSPEFGYRDALRSADVNRLLVFNWATWFGLEDVQGYNPVQVQRYVEYMDALNGHGQEYHEADIFPSGLASPLLDLLNLRYLIVPAALDLAALAPSGRELTSVYSDGTVRIVENPGAYPRTWLVHEARQAAPGEALPLLATGRVDARQTALLDVPPPPLAIPAAPGQESARVIVQQPDRVVLHVVAETAGLLIVSDVWDPGWSAVVSGEPAPVLAAHHVLRAVPVPAGEHIVELGFDPPLLRLGIFVTLLSSASLSAAAIAARRADRRRIFGGGEPLSHRSERGWGEGFSGVGVSG